MNQHLSFRLIWILVVGLTILAFTVVFGVVDAVVVRPLPYAHAHDLVAVHCALPGIPNLPVSALEIDSIRDASVFSEVALYRQGQAPVASSTGIGVAHGLMVSPNFLKVLGTQPDRGRDFGPQDADQPVALLTAAMCAQYFPPGRCLGRSVKIMGEAHMIVGELPPSFQFGPGSFQGNDLAEFLIATNFPHEAAVDDHDLPAIARMRPGLSLDAVNRRLGQVSAALGTARASKSEMAAHLFARPLAEEIEGPAGPIIQGIFWAVFMLLLLAAASLAGLQLARTAAEMPALAVKAALGASRWNLISPIVREMLWLSAIGGGGGLLLGWGALPWLQRRIPPELPRAYHLPMDWRIAATAAVGAATLALIATLASVGPLWRCNVAELLCCRRSIRPALAGRGARTVIAVQLAMALALLAGMAEMGQSVWRLTQQNPGFDLNHFLAAEFHLPDGVSPTARRATMEKLRQSLAALPGVSEVAIAATPPASRSLNAGQVVVARGATHLTLPNIWFQVAGPRYLNVLGIPLLQGRAFVDSDSVNAQPVVLINHAFEQAYLGGADPLGVRLEFELAPHTWLRVVGVTADFRDAALTMAPEPEIILPASQSSAWFDSLLVRTQSNPDALAASVRIRARAQAPGFPVEITTGPDLVRAASRRQVFVGWCFLAFAGFALAVAALGMFAAVVERVRFADRDLAVRTALGASQGQIARLVMGWVAGLALPGAIGGLAAAAVLGDSLQALLYRTQPIDPLALGLALAILLSLVGTACIAPAWRAARLDPSRLLRGE